MNNSVDQLPEHKHVSHLELFVEAASGRGVWQGVGRLARVLGGCWFVSPGVRDPARLGTPGPGPWAHYKNTAYLAKS